MTIPFHLEPDQALNILQLAALVSDNCITLDEVARADVKAAEEYLRQSSSSSVAKHSGHSQ